MERILVRPDLLPSLQGIAWVPHRHSPSLTPSPFSPSPSLSPRTLYLIRCFNTKICIAFCLLDLRYYEISCSVSTKKDLYSRVCELVIPRSFVTMLISQTLVFKLNVTLTSVFNFTVLLSYRAIHVFLVQKFSCSVATHGYAT